jgi:radical SAM protein with 4Fe4S-binding SPASM domain
LNADPGTLGPLLRRLVDEDELAFDGLFDASGARNRVALPPELARPLREARLVEGDDDQLWGLCRARRLGRRVYFLELDEGEQYHQDVWPETDALIAELERAPAGRCLDVGTGCGIIAIEAALRGLPVVATDLYPTAVELARWNARLNGAEGIDFRVGHLFEPVVGERFDLVLTAPHYGRVFDQLRIEVLRASLDHLTPDGRLCLATALEWEEGQAPGVESVLRPLEARGAGIRISPIVNQKRSWFAFQTGEVARLTSRHRFLVEVRAGGGGFQREAPPADSQPTLTVVPLSRLRAGATAAVTKVDDVESLRALLGALTDTTARFEAIPPSFLDGCRWGAQSCVGPGGAAGALVDLDGKVRPCTHGGAVGTVGDSLTGLERKLKALADEAEARRGCRECEARSVCSRCLFPAVLDDAAYCALVKSRATELPLLHRLVDIAARLGGLAAPVRLERWPRAVAAGASPAWPSLTERWNQRGYWILSDGARTSLWWPSSRGPTGNQPTGNQIDEQLGWLGGRVGDGAARDEIERTRAAAGVGERRLASLLERLATLLGVDPTTVTARTSP